MNNPTVLLWCIWLAWMLVVAVHWRPPHCRVLPASMQAAELATGSDAGFAQRIGTRVFAALGRPADPVRDRTFGRAVVLAAVVFMVSPLLGVAALVATFIAPTLRLRAANKRRHAELLRELPEVIDLLRLAVSAGGTLHMGVQIVGANVRGPVTEALAHVRLRVAQGVRLADALEQAVLLVGDPGLPLWSALMGAERYGTSVTHPLERLAAAARDDRRRHAEVVARKIPIRMLLPLVVCVLPAFVLITLVPTLAGSFTTLRFGGP